jgi:hypothetical protein
MIGHLPRPAIDWSSLLHWLPAALLLAAFAQRPAVANEGATGVLLYQQIDATTYRYHIDLQNSGATSIGTLWYSWADGKDMLPSNPLGITSPAGWTGTVTHSGQGDGYGIQWVNTASPLAPGHMQGGFWFDSHDAPPKLAGNASPPSSIGPSASIVFGGAPNSDAGAALNIAPTTRPWQNPFLPLDVDRSSTITPFDALLIINALGKAGPRPLGTPAANQNQAFVDVNGDGSITPQDALQVIDQLNWAHKKTDFTGTVGYTSGYKGVIAYNLNTLPANFIVVPPSTSALQVVYGGGRIVTGSNLTTGGGSLTLPGALSVTQQSALLVTPQLNFPNKKTDFTGLNVSHPNSILVSPVNNVNNPPAFQFINGLPADISVAPPLSLALQGVFGGGGIGILKTGGDQMAVAAVPEPSSLTLLAIAAGLLLLAAARRTRIWPRAARPIA